MPIIARDHPGFHVLNKAPNASLNHSWRVDNQGDQSAQAALVLVNDTMGGQLVDSGPTLTVPALGSVVLQLNRPAVLEGQHLVSGNNSMRLIVEEVGVAGSVAVHPYTIVFTLPPVGPILVADPAGPTIS